MKSLHYNTRLVVAGMLLIFAARGVYAAGTPAGTVISSRATAIFTSLAGSHVDTVYSSYVTIIVKQVGAVNVLVPSLTRNSADGVTLDYPLSVINSGNGTDKFTLGGVSSHSWLVSIYRDINGNGILDAVDSAAGVIAASDSVKADSSFKIVVRVAVPNNEILNGLTDSAIVTASSLFDPTRNGGSHLQTHVQTALINPSSALAVDNPAPVPPGPITFTFALTNSGQSAATNLVIVDKLDPRFTYVSSTQGGVNISSDTVRWSIPIVGAGGFPTFSVTLNLQANLTPGTLIPNSMSLVYHDGLLLRSKTSNTVIVGIGNVYGVSISPDSLSSQREPDDSAKYYLTVRNTGNRKDVIELAAVSSQPLTWTFLKDANNNRVIDPLDIALKNTNGKDGVDVDSVSAGDSVHVFAVAVVPMVAIDQTKDVTVFTATSSASAIRTASAVGTTTTNIPVVNVALSVSPSPSQPQPPGSVLTYTISYSNGGHADIDTSYTLSARIPDSTSYVLGSVKLGTLALPDSSAVRNGKLVVKTGGLKQSSSGTIEFKVKIK